MSYRIGEVRVMGNPPSNVINVLFGKKTTDGGKARIQARRRLIHQNEPIHDWRNEDLTMGCPDPEYIAPDNDCA